LKKKLTEEQYIKREVDWHNKKNPGSGDKWLESWKYNTREKNQQSFLEEVNKQYKGEEMYFIPDKKDAKYTVIVHTIYLYPRGYEKSELKVEILIVDTKNPEDILIQFTGSLIKDSSMSYGSSNAMANTYMMEAPAFANISRFILTRKRNNPG